MPSWNRDVQAVEEQKFSKKNLKGLLRGPIGTESPDGNGMTGNGQCLILKLRIETNKRYGSDV